MYLADQTPNDR